MSRAHPDPGRRPALIAGAALAVVVAAVPFLRFVFGYLGILIHELGHTVAHWAFGRPSIPAFDFAHGGGVTMTDPRQPVLVVAIGAVLAIGAWRVRDRRRLAVAVLALGTAWALAMISRMDVAIGLAAGHLAVLLLAALFVHRAHAGSGLRSAAERPAYAFAGIFLWIGEVGFAWNLATRHEARVEYELAKRGGAWMDLSRLAGEFLGTSLTTTAAAYLVVATVVPALGFAAGTGARVVARGLGWLAEIPDPGEGPARPRVSRTTGDAG